MSQMQLITLSDASAVASMG